MESASKEEIEAFLAHHGVKGMHWGVRKAQESEEHRDYRKSTERQFRKETTSATVRRVEKTLGSDLTKEEYGKLSSKDVRYRPGKTLSRVTRDAEGDASKSTLFVSTNKDDANRYRAVLPYQDSGIRALFKSGNNKYDGFQETTYKATKALLGPSEKERVDAFVRLMDTPAVTLANGKTITGREYLKRTGLGYDARRLDAQRLGLKYYNKFLADQWRDTPINSAYFKSLREKGYNVVADENDRGILTKDPLIILDPNGSVKRMSVRRLSTDDVLRAQFEYKDLSP